MRIYHKLEIEEPQHCEYPNCKEELNGLHHCWIRLLDFNFDIWICNEHFNKLKENYEIIEK